MQVQFLEPAPPGQELLLSSEVVDITQYGDDGSKKESVEVSMLLSQVTLPALLLATPAVYHLPDTCARGRWSLRWHGLGLEILQVSLLLHTTHRSAKTNSIGKKACRQDG